MTERESGWKGDGRQGWGGVLVGGRVGGERDESEGSGSVKKRGFADLS